MRSLFFTSKYSLNYDVAIDCYEIVRDSDKASVFLQTEYDKGVIEHDFKIEAGFCNFDDDEDFDILCSQYDEVME